MRRNTLAVLIVTPLLAFTAVACSSEATPEAQVQPAVATKDASVPEETTAAPKAKATTKAPVVVEETTEAPAEPKLSVEQQNAIKSAESYLENMAFSRKALIEQLSSEYGAGFPKKIATFAVDSLDINYNEQAAKSAQSYLDSMAFSRQGLIEQLESESGAGFTHKQAVYGVKQVM